MNKKTKVYFTKAGGNSSGEAFQRKVNIPAAWAKDMGIYKDDNDIELYYNMPRQEITIRKSRKKL